MDSIIKLLSEQPLLLLFVVSAIGYPLGRLRIGRTRLGVVSVLFTGLAAGAIHQDLILPEIVSMLGLVLFVYTIGLSSGSTFISSFRQRGWLYNLVVVGSLILAFGLAALIKFFLQVDSPLAAGIFSGSLTNTPSLAGILELIRGAPSAQAEIQTSQAVIAYALTYPGGVLGIVLVISVFKRVWKVNFETERLPTNQVPIHNEPLYTRTIRITQPYTMTVAEFMRKNTWNVIFGRIRSGDEYSLVTGKSVLRPNDLVTLIGTQSGLESATAALGETSDERLEFDVTRYDRRRIIVSNAHTAGRSLGSLELVSRFGAMVTCIHRGHMDMLPHGDTVINLGDQVMVVAPHTQMDALASLLGDSVRAMSEIDILTLSIGLALGLIVGFTPIALPGGITLKLGMAGGPLVVALILGAIGRSGPFLWSIPYSVNMTLRQIGLVLFLAGIGTRAGHFLLSMVAKPTSLILIFSGLLITCLTCVLILVIGYKLLHIPMGLLLGIAAGAQTQPAVLGYSLDQTSSELPNIGYITVYPIALITKIILAQVLFLL
jgi:putative transport protein